MRNFIVGTLLVCAGLTAFGGSAAAPAPQSVAPMVTEVKILRLKDDAADNPARLDWSGYSSSSWSKWIDVDDVPADLRNRALSTESYVSIDLDETGKAIACRIVKASSESRLDRLACDLLSRRGEFQPLYTAPARAIPSRAVMGVRWRVMDAETFAERQRAYAESLRTAVPPPPRLDSYPEFSAWPRLDWSHNIRIAALPPIQAHYPAGAGRPAEGVVGLDLIVRPETGVAECQIGTSSGNKALDDAACNVARLLELSYTKPCGPCWQARVPLQVVWRKRGSHIRLPLARPGGTSEQAFPRDPADTRAAVQFVRWGRLIAPVLSPADFDRIADKSYLRHRVRANLKLDEKGRTIGCTFAVASGNPAIDARICELLMKRARFTPRTDIFGDPAVNTHPLLIDLKTLL